MMHEDKTDFSLSSNTANKYPSKKKILYYFYANLSNRCEFSCSNYLTEN